MPPPDATHLPTLNVDDLCVWRGDIRLIDGLSFSVAAGELLWLRGDNGIGKTSLLRVLAGFAPPERGALRWRGADPGADPSAWRSELLYLGHLDALKRDLTARENLASDAALRGAADGTAIDSALATLAVARCADLPVAQLSAGQRRRVALARLALSQATVWLLDEPTTHLDADGQGVVGRLIDRHLGRGGLAVVASHHALELARPARTLELGARPRVAA